MTIEQCRRQIGHLPATENVAWYFSNAGFVTAKKIMEAVEASPDDHYVTVLDWDDTPEIRVCQRAALGKFST